MTLQEIIGRRETLLADRREKTEAHNAFMLATAKELDGLRDAEALIVGGLDLDKIERGRAVIQIRGLVGKIVHGVYTDQRRDDTRAKVLADAKADIAAGGAKLKRQYFGIKNYSGFGDQRSDHEYCMGPRHGSIVFSIGLNFSYPQVPAGIELTAEQIDDALYLLSALPQIEALTSAAKVAA